MDCEDGVHYLMSLNLPAGVPPHLGLGAALFLTRVALLMRPQTGIGVSYTVYTSVADTKIDCGVNGWED